MIYDYQIAHDLAIAKLCGSSLSNEETYEKYCQYRDAFIELIKANKQPVVGGKVEVFQRLY